MGRRHAPHTFRGEDPSTYCRFQLNRSDPADRDGKRILRIRLFYKKNMNQSPVIFQGEKVKLLEEHFQDGTVTGGYANGNLNRLKIRLVQLAIRACQVGDMVKMKLSDTDFRTMLYEAITEPAQEEIINADTVISEVIEKTPWLWMKDVQSKQEDIISGKISVADFNKNMLIGLNKIDKRNLTTEQIFKNGLFDKNNIFEVFSNVYYDDESETYQKILIRLMEYREHRKPAEDVKYFNVDWILRFFRFLEEKGWYQINTVSFDPLNYDPAIFFKDKPREPYMPKSLNKMIGIIKTLTKSYSAKGWLPKTDLSGLELSKITAKQDKDGTRIEHNLSKEELDELFWYQFDKNRQNEYQDIFNQCNKSLTVPITVEDIETARALFILQVSFGGQRGFTELHTSKILKVNRDEFAVSYFANKGKANVTNPLNDYSYRVLKPLNYKVPKLKRVNARAPGKQTDSIALL